MNPVVLVEQALFQIFLVGEGAPGGATKKNRGTHRRCGDTPREVDATGQAATLTRLTGMPS